MGRNNNYGGNFGRGHGGYGSYGDKKGNGSKKKKIELSAYVPAPYNFISLNTVILPSPVMEYCEETGDQVKGYKKFLESEETFSGYVEVSVSNLTPLYIDNNNRIFKNGSKVCIPGSSMRGCLKNIFKIYTNSKFSRDEDITDRILYYRSFASGYEKFRELYSDNITSREGSSKRGEDSVRKTKPGFLVKKREKDDSYFICPAQFDAILVKPEEPNYPNTGRPGSKAIIWDKDDPYKAKVYPERKGIKPRDGKYRNGNVHYYVIHSPRLQELLRVNKVVVDSYVGDVERKGMALLSLEDGGAKNLKIGYAKKTKAFDFCIPCFYVDDESGVAHFGATPYYRIPYKLSIGDHIPKSHEVDIVDFTEAMFGSKEKWASRIQVEDFYTTGNVVQEEECTAKPLLNPKPTSFQFYLEPHTKRYTGGIEKGECRHWEDGNALLRGYKQYWHKAADWKSPNPDNKNVAHSMAPIKPGHVFRGHIRFTQLTKVELGALLTFFNLVEGKDKAYKIGMGKPLGLGSIALQAKLYLQDENYYKSLFDGDCFSKGLVAEGAVVSQDDCIQEFQAYIKENMPFEGRQENEKRVKNLKLMLDSSCLEGEKAEKWQKDTRYLDINGKGTDKNGVSDRDYINQRIALPLVEEVVKWRGK